MKMIKTIIFLAMAITTLKPGPTHSQPGSLRGSSFPTKRSPGRFFAQLQSGPTTNGPRYSCGQDGRSCGHFLGGSGNGTCCNNKCVETTSDAGNCGACGQKCGFGEACCKGECVNSFDDRRHCGFCNNMCEIHGACVYGICDYAI